VCITELADVCNTLDATVTIEPAGDTAARLIAATDNEVNVDAWVTFAPGSQIVRDQRARDAHTALLDDDEGPLARTPLVVAALDDRAAALRQHCGADLTWKCIGEVAGQPWTAAGGQETWGVVRPAHPEPQTSATGLLVLGQIVASYLASPDLSVGDISRVDWETNDGFASWFQQLERSVPAEAFSPGVDPFARWLQARARNQYGVVAATEAEAVPALAASAADIKDNTTVLYPAPVATADVVLAPVHEGRSTNKQQDALRVALKQAGFRTPGGNAPTDPPLPATNGLPSAGALDALRGYWKEVVG
jgi:hypothetical protein